MYKIGFYENLDGALTAPEVVIREFPGAEYEKFRGKPRLYGMYIPFIVHGLQFLIITKSILGWVRLKRS